MNDFLFENLGIYDLRNIARQKGVKNPTTKTRNELVKEIQVIEQGIQKPFFNHSNRGRPFKKIDLPSVTIFDCEHCPLYQKNYRIDKFV